MSSSFLIVMICLVSRVCELCSFSQLARASKLVHNHSKHGVAEVGRLASEKAGTAEAIL